MTPRNTFAALAAGSLTACLGLAPITGLSVRAQVRTAAPDPRGQIRVEVNLVNVVASVLDRNNRPAADLTLDQFEIDEEGKPQKIDVFEPETQQPIDLALMIDTSLSAIADLSFESEAAAHFLGQVVRPGDRAAVYEFSDQVTQMAGFSDDLPRLQSAVKHVVPGDGTAIYDAVYLGSEALAKGAAGRRRVIVMITDAGETTSRADFETARRAAVRAEALLYTIVIREVKSEGGRNTAGEHALETIADSTGGAIFYPDALSQLAVMFDQIDRELRTQYRLGFYPDPRPPKGVYREIEVHVKGDYKVLSRKSYYSGGPEE